MNALFALVKCGIVTLFEHTIDDADHHHQIWCHFEGKIASGRHSDVDAAAMQVLDAIEKHQDAQEADAVRRVRNEECVLAFTLRRGEQLQFFHEALCMESDRPQYSTTVVLDIGVACFKKTFDSCYEDAMRAVLMEDAARWIVQHEAK